MIILRLKVSFLAVLFASSAMADAIYNVTVDTTSASGTMGSDGVLVGTSCPCATGDVSGTLPATLTFDNSTPFNDYFEGFTFGTSIAFNVRLYGPAVNSPDGISTSGSTFAFSMFSDPAGTTPLLTSDTADGFAFTLDVNLDGTTTNQNFSPQTTVALAGTGIPEPATLELLEAAMAAVALLRFCKAR